MGRTGTSRFAAFAAGTGTGETTRGGSGAGAGFKGGGGGIDWTAGGGVGAGAGTRAGSDAREIEDTGGTRSGMLHCALSLANQSLPWGPCREPSSVQAHVDGSSPFAEGHFGFCVGFLLGNCGG